jgi:hypothetical protein
LESEKSLGIPLTKKPRLTNVNLDINIKPGLSHVWKEAFFNKQHPSLLYSLYKGMSHKSNVTHGKQKTETDDSICIELRWKCEMVKCVDASPLVLQFSE